MQIQIAQSKSLDKLVNETFRTLGSYFRTRIQIPFEVSGLKEEYEKLVKVVEKPQDHSALIGPRVIPISEITSYALDK